MFSATEILELAEKIEENGEVFYRDAAKRVLNPLVRDLFIWLAEEEVKHREWFSTEKKKLPKEGGDQYLIDAGNAILKNILDDQTFSLKDTDPSKMKRVEDLFRAAQEFENDTILFFEMIMSLVSDFGTMEHLEDIIEEERHHIERLSEFERMLLAEGQKEGQHED